MPGKVKMLIIPPKDGRQTGSCTLNNRRKSLIKMSGRKKFLVSSTALAAGYGRAKLLLSRATILYQFPETLMYFY